MARDPQAALVALNRFGFGARGAASGDFDAAVADPRGFVKAELAKPNAAMLVAPGLLSTPELGQALFAYQKDVRAQRAAQKAAATDGAPPPQSPAPVPVAPPVPIQRSLSGATPDQRAAASGDGMSAQSPSAAPA